MLIVPCVVLRIVLLMTLGFLSGFSVIVQTLPLSDTDLNYQFKSVAHQQVEAIGPQNAITQDTQGFMWFGGESGLARFDGYKMRLFLNDPDDPHSLSGNYIYALCVDLDGRLWVATNVGLNLYDAELERFTRFEHNPDDPNSLSSNNVRALAKSYTGALWVATEEGLNRLDDPSSGHFHRYRHQAGNPNSLSSNRLRSLLEDSEHNLWLGSIDTGLTRFNVSAGSFQHFRHEPQNPRSLSQNYIDSLYQDNQGRIWVSSRTGGLHRFVESSGDFVRYQNDPDKANSLASNHVSQVIEDRDNHLWVATDGGGVHRYYPGTETFTRFQYDQFSGRSLLSNKVKSMFVDKDGDLWFGHFPYGVSMLDRYAMMFTKYQHQVNNPNSLSHSAILSVMEDRTGSYATRNLWVGTEGGLNYIDRNVENSRVEQITRYVHDPKDPYSLSANPVLSLLRDSRGDLWVGTWGGGLNRLPAGSDRFIHYLPDPNKPRSISGMRVWALLEDSQQRLWVGTQSGGLNRYHPESDDFSRFPHTDAEQNAQITQKLEPRGVYSKGISSHRVTVLYQDQRQDLWVGTTNGLDRINHDTGIVRHYRHNSQDRRSLSSDYIRTIMEDSSGRFWVGTQGGGVNLLDRDSGQVKTYRLKDGLANDIVTNIVEDYDGFLWFSTNQGLSRFDAGNQSFRNFSQMHGLPGNAFNRYAGIKSYDNRLVFGSTNGLVTFDPAALDHDNPEQNLAFTRLQVWNKEQLPNVAGSPLQKSISLTSALTFNHRQSAFSLEFAALNYRMPSQIRYAYRLTGFDQQWNYSEGEYSDSHRVATYTNLDRGDYLFEVKASNSEGEWLDATLVMPITILSPWWLTWWAYSIYALLVSALVGMVFYIRGHKKQVEYEQLVNQRLLQIDKMKDTFLANTSHELRTPLNGIIGLSEALIVDSGNQVSEKIRQNLTLILNSSRRLSFLINDILDFSKLREHTIKLHRQSVDLHTLTDVVLSLITPLVAGKPLTVYNKVDKYLPSVLADENRLQQIMYNLIGNAIKFTEKGSVTISSEVLGEQIWIEVRDTGIGIAQDQLDKVFQPFEQVGVEAEASEEARALSASSGGTGLGMAVTKQLVELHGGTIEVKSEFEQGSTFRFCLSHSGKTLSEPKVQAPANYQSDSDLSFLTTKELACITEAQETYDAHILIVDDEAVNRQILTNLLSLLPYRVTACTSGFQALEILGSSNDIDLVLLDIMMPGMSGLEVCKTLREKYDQHQLPVIFLTARAQVRDMELAFGVGANDFLNKPIAREELFPRIKAHLELLDNNRILEQKIAERTQTIEQKNQTLKQQNEKLQDNHIKLQQAQSQLVHSEKISALGILVAGVAHEINNPANFSYIAANNLNQRLKKFQIFLLELAGDDVDEEILTAFDQHFKALFRHIETVHTGTGRINSIVESLSHFSRKDATEAHPEPLEKGLLSTVQLVKSNFKDHIEFICDLTENPIIECIPSELNQVFMNVMINACQAMKSKYDEMDDKSTVNFVLLIGMHVIEGELAVSFADNGIGMSEEVKSHIFDPFYTTKPFGEGTGLGMAITYGILERHKARIEIQSEVNVGTKITLVFPLHDR